MSIHAPPAPHTLHVPPAPAPRRAHPPLKLLALAAVAALAAACATQPGSDGKAIFNTFNQCMAANGVGAAVIGVVTKKVTGNTAVGIAAAAGTLFVAWKACGKAHQRVEVSGERGRDAVLADARYRQAQGGLLSLDQLDVSAPKAGDDITTRYQFAYTSADPARKDIAAKERFVFMAGFINDKGAQEFKDIEFERDFVMQQGQRQHAHSVPTDASFGEFKPWKLRYQLEVDGRCVETEASFTIPGAPGRAGPARACQPRQAARADAGGKPSATATPAAAASPATAAGPAQPAAASAEPEATLLRSLRLQAQPGGAPVGKALPQGARVRVLETRATPSGERTLNWLRVRSESGETGWTRDTNLRR